MGVGIAEWLAHWVSRTSSCLLCCPCWTLYLMFHYTKACTLELVLWVKLYTSIVAFVNDYNKEHYYYYYFIIIFFNIIIISIIIFQDQKFQTSPWWNMESIIIWNWPDGTDLYKLNVPTGQIWVFETDRKCQKWMNNQLTTSHTSW